LTFPLQNVQRPDGTAVATHVAIYSVEFFETRISAKFIFENLNSPKSITAASSASITRDAPVRARMPFRRYIRHVTSASLRARTRSAGRKARAELRDGDRRRCERQLITHIDSVVAVQAPAIGVFVAHDGEPDLQPLVDLMRARGQTVALPTMQDDLNDFSMTYMTWHANDSLRDGRYGIPVPRHGEPIEPDTLLVSIVGFDVRGNRIGRGGGFFDRYLATSAATVVGVAFEAQRFDSVPVEPHDVALPTIVTERGVRYVDHEKPGPYHHRSAT